MELRLHREKDQLNTENSELRTKMDHLKQQNMELERKINNILQWVFARSVPISQFIFNNDIIII